MIETIIHSQDFSKFVIKNICICSKLYIHLLLCIPMPVLIESLCFLTCCSDLQFLEKENARLELEVEKILGELNHQKDQNNLKREKIVQLEISLKPSKVLPFFHKVSTI